MGTIIDYEYRHTDRLRASPNNRVVTRPSEKFEGNYYMQNKPNFRNSQMNVSIFSQKDYENIPPIKNAKTNPIKPNFSLKTRVLPKTNPIEPNSNPKTRLTNPIEPNFNPETRLTNPNKANLVRLRRIQKPHPNSPPQAEPPIDLLTNSPAQLHHFRCF